MPRDPTQTPAHPPAHPSVRRPEPPPAGTRGRYTVRALTRRVPVLITEPETLFHAGQPVNALADGTAHCVYIDGSVPPAERVELLLHEVWHLYRFVVDQPRTIEGECDLFAMAAAAVLADVEAQGGTAALMALRPTTVKGGGHG